MTKPIFKAANILLPHDNFEKWSVIACDQFTSDREYWKNVENTVGGAESTLKLIYPEVYLGDGDREKRLSAISDYSRYLTHDNILARYSDSFVLVRRTLSTGKTRWGIVGALDLDAYNYADAKTVVSAQDVIQSPASMVRPSEETVPSRLPARIEVRKAQAVETTHVIALIDDPRREIIEPLALAAPQFPLLYDFDLMQGGGHITGWRVTGEAARKIESRIADIKSDVKIVIGDGNHSLAAAKAAGHRFALVELCNVYDEGIEFFPIHRAVFGTDNDKGCIIEVNSKDLAYHEIVETIDRKIADMPHSVVDYIHGDDELAELVRERGAIGFKMPALNKDGLFKTIESRGVFPRKSFSIGLGKDKRYYLECGEQITENI